MISSSSSGTRERSEFRSLSHSNEEDIVRRPLKTGASSAYCPPGVRFNGPQVNVVEAVRGFIYLPPSTNSRNVLKPSSRAHSWLPAIVTENYIIECGRRLCRLVFHSSNCSAFPATESFHKNSPRYDLVILGGSASTINSGPESRHTKNDDWRCPAFYTPPLFAQGFRGYY